MSKQIIKYFSLESQKQNQFWTPDQLTPYTWWDPSDEASITEVGGNVSQIDDKSGNTNHLLQGSGANQPVTGTRSIGGLNVLDITADKWMSFTSIDMIGKEVWAIFQIDDVTEDFFVLGATGNRQFSFNTGQQAMRLWPGYNAPFFSSITLLQDTPYFNAWIASTPNQAYSVNGVYETRGSYQSGTLDMNRICRAQYSHSYNSDGMLGEIIITDVTSTEDRQKMEGYLAWKWGLQSSLPGGHPYENAAPLR